MNDGFEVGIVKVKRVRGDAVDQRSAGHVNFLSASQYAGLLRGLQHIDGGQRGVSRLVVSCAHGTTQPIHKGAMRFVVNCVAPATGRMVGNKLRKNLSDRRSVVVCSDLGITGHRASFGGV